LKPQVTLCRKAYLKRKKTVEKSLAYIEKQFRQLYGVKYKTRDNNKTYRYFNREKNICRVGRVTLETPCIMYIIHIFFFIIIYTTIGFRR